MDPDAEVNEENGDLDDEAKAKKKKDDEEKAKIPSEVSSILEE